MERWKIDMSRMSQLKVDQTEIGVANYQFLQQVKSNIMFMNVQANANI
jgi:hypothetical protein